MRTQPTILRRDAQAGLLHWATTWFEMPPAPRAPILARMDHHQSLQRLLEDVAALIRKTW
jgi:hypothetical protein